MPMINGVNPAASMVGAQSGPATSLGGLDSEAFLKLLVAQMRYQDPMSPTDHTAMLQQTSQFTQVEALQKVTEMQQQLLGLSQASMAADLVGKEVVAARQGDSALVGVVESVRFTSHGPMLAVGGEEVPMSSATEIRAPGGGAPGSETDSMLIGDGAQGLPEPGQQTASVDMWTGPWSLDA